MGLANQSATPGRTTLLDAVNILLAVNGEAPVNSLDDPVMKESSIAERTLLEFHKQEQTRGWSWNSEQDYPFAVATDGTITVPSNLTRFAPDPFQWDGRFILRGQRVYDRVNRTYVLTGAAVTQLTADVVWTLPWDDCPEVFNRYISILGARAFANRFLGSDSIEGYTQQDLLMARTELDRNELQQLQPNSLSGQRGVLPFGTFNPAAGLAGRGYPGLFF